MISDFPMTSEEIFKYYLGEVEPVYTYLVAIKGEKPLQALVEIENTFKHLANAAIGFEIEKNMQRASAHMTRLHLDLYKLLAVEVKILIENRDKDIHSPYVNAIRKARASEVNHVGDKSQNDSLDRYKEAINVGLKELELDLL